MNARPVFANRVATSCYAWLFNHHHHCDHHRHLHCCHWINSCTELYKYRQRSYINGTDQKDYGKLLSGCVAMQCCSWSVNFLNSSLRQATRRKRSYPITIIHENLPGLASFVCRWFWRKQPGKEAQQKQGQLCVLLHLSFRLPPWTLN